MDQINQNQEKTNVKSLKIQIPKLENVITKGNSASETKQQNPPENIFKQVLKYILQIPLFVKTVIGNIIVTYIMSLFLENQVVLMQNVPETTIFRFHLWTLITTVFVNTHLLSLIYSLFHYISDASNLETANCTVRYFINFITNSFIIQILFIVLSLILSLIFPHFINNGSAGLMPIVMVEITILSLANPNSVVNFMYIPIDFQAKFYPLVVYAFYLIINLFNLQIDVVIGIFYGALYFKYLRKYFEISNEKIQKIENFLSFMKKLPGYVDSTQIKQSVKYATFNNSQSSFELPTTPGAKISPQQLNNVHIKVNTFDANTSNIDGSVRSDDKKDGLKSVVLNDLNDFKAGK